MTSAALVWCQSFQMQFFVQLCSSWEEFSWHKASRGLSATADILVWLRLSGPLSQSLWWSESSSSSVFRATCHILACRAFVTSMASVRLYICLSVCDVGGLWSHDTTKKWKSADNRIGDVLTTCIPKPTRIVLSCDPGYGVENVEFCTSTASDGSHVALSQNLLSYLTYHVRRVLQIKLLTYLVRSRYQFRYVRSNSLHACL